MAALASELTTDSAVCSAAWIQSGMPTPSKAMPVRNRRGWRGELAADRLDAVEVAEGVLGHGARMAADLERAWGARDADQVAQLARDQLLDRVVGQVEQLGLGRPADEDAHQHRARGRAAGELDAQERDGQDRSALDRRHDGAEAVERVLDLVAAVGDVDDDRRGVRNRPELQGQVAGPTRRSAGPSRGPRS